MNEREKLVELLKRADDKCASTKQCENCVGFGKGADCVDFLFADHLIANGVIVPPCKIGDTVFAIPSKVNCELNIMHNMHHNNRIYEQVVDHITIWQSDYMLYTCDGLCAVRSKAYKDTWFTTREEAEKALAERVQK